MNFRKTLLQTAVAAAVVGASSAAVAGNLVGATTTSVGSAAYTYDIETVGTNAVYTADVSAGTSDFITFPVSATNDFLIKFTLSSGTWNAAMTTNLLGLSQCGTTNPTATLIAGGTTADSFVTYRINKAATATAACSAGGAVSVMWSAAQAGGLAIKNPTGLATATGKLTIKTEVTDTGNTAIFSVGTADLTGASVAGSQFKLTGNSTANVVDVAATSLKFTDGKVTANLGKLEFTPSAGRALNTNAAFAFSASDTLTVTVSGDFSAAAASNPVFYDTNGDGVYNTGDILATVTGNSTATLKIPLTTASGQNIMYTVNGTSVIPAPTTYSAAGTVTWATSTYVAPTLTTNSAFNAFSKNGSTTFSQFINPAAEEASSGYISVVRLTNTGSVAGTIKAILTLDDGTSGTCDLPITGTTDNKLGVGKSIIVLTSSIESCAGKAIPAGQKGRIRFEGQLTKMVVQTWNMNTANKTLTNQGANDPGSNNI